MPKRAAPRVGHQARLDAFLSPRGGAGGRGRAADRGSRFVACPACFADVPATLINEHPRRRPMRGEGGSDAAETRRRRRRRDGRGRGQRPRADRAHRERDAVAKIDGRERDGRARGRRRAETRGRRRRRRRRLRFEGWERRHRERRPRATRRRTSKTHSRGSCARPRRRPPRTRRRSPGIISSSTSSPRTRRTRSSPFSTTASAGSTTGSRRRSTARTEGKRGGVRVDLKRRTVSPPTREMPPRLLAVAEKMRGAHALLARFSPNEAKRDIVRQAPRRPTALARGRPAALVGRAREPLTVRRVRHDVRENDDAVVGRRDPRER